MQRAVIRSQRQEDDRSPIRRMGRESAFLNNNNERFRSAAPLKNGGSARVDPRRILPRSHPACNTFYRRLSLHALRCCPSRDIKRGTDPTVPPTVSCRLQLLPMVSVPFSFYSIVADRSPVAPKCSGRIPTEPDVADDAALTRT